MFRDIHRLIAFLLLALPAGAEVINVTDTKGRNLIIELLALEDDTVAFEVPAQKNKEYELPIDRFDAASQARIREASKNLKPRVPKLDFDVAVEKRRKKVGYYMVQQTVTTKVSVKNLSRTIDLPPCKCRILFVGRNRKNNDLYMILNVQEFEAAAPKGDTFKHETKPFTTEYDSDNAGAGNVGGYQYDAYIVMLSDGDENILASHSSDPSIRSALKDDLLLLPKVAKYPKGTQMNARLQKVDNVIR